MMDPGTEVQGQPRIEQGTGFTPPTRSRPPNTGSENRSREAPNDSRTKTHTETQIFKSDLETPRGFDRGTAGSPKHHEEAHPRESLRWRGRGGDGGQPPKGMGGGGPVQGNCTRLRSRGPARGSFIRQPGPLWPQPTLGIPRSGHRMGALHTLLSVSRVEIWRESVGNRGGSQLGSGVHPASRMLSPSPRKDSSPRVSARRSPWRQRSAKTDSACSLDPSKSRRTRARDCLR